MSFWENFWDIFWWFFFVYAFVAFLWVLFAVIGDLFRDDKWAASEFSDSGPP